MKALKQRGAAVLLAVVILLGGSIVGPQTAAAAPPKCYYYSGPEKSSVEVCSIYTGPYFQTRLTVDYGNIATPLGRLTQGTFGYVSNGARTGKLITTSSRAEGKVVLWGPTVRMPAGYAQARVYYVFLNKRLNSGVFKNYRIGTTLYSPTVKVG